MSAAFTLRVAQANSMLTNSFVCTAMVALPNASNSNERSLQTDDVSLGAPAAPHVISPCTLSNPAPVPRSLRIRQEIRKSALPATLPVHCPPCVGVNCCHLPFATQPGYTSENLSESTSLPSSGHGLADTILC